MLNTEATLAELVAASGLQPRTIRSWVAQGLLPGPLSRGPFARYPVDMLERVLAVRTMRDVLGMPLAAIRQELLVASPEQIRAHAAKAAGLAHEQPEPGRPIAPAPDAAMNYLRGLRAEAPRAMFRRATPLADVPSPAAEDELSATSGFEGLERRLLAGREGKPPVRKARAESWLRIPVTPDIELAIRGSLDAEQRARLERCADLIRDILLGRDR
jgi:DNA-binding transcriptional MerR regulator